MFITIIIYFIVTKMLDFQPVPEKGCDISQFRPDIGELKIF